MTHSNAQRRLSPEEAITQILELPEGHAYRALAEDTYRPGHATDDAIWALARDAALVILAPNRESPQALSEHPDAGRNNLCHYLYWLAVGNPAMLAPNTALDDENIQRFIVNEGTVRRSSQRSRVALGSGVRAFRHGYPDLFPQRKLPSSEGAELPPVEDWQFQLAWEETAAFRNAETRGNVRGLLLLGRGAGLDASEMRWASGLHVHHEPAAGTWVTVVRAGHEREVPVLARYGDLLEDLACARGERSLIANCVAPCDASQASSLGRVLSRSLGRHGHAFSVAAEMLRKAWLIEHVASNTPIPTFLAAAGLTSLRSLERLLPYAPQPPTSKIHLAYELGGIEQRYRHRGN